MSTLIGPALTARPAVLVADDEPDVHAVTRLSLKGLRPGGRRLKLHRAATGAAAVALVRAHSNIAVVLLDVIMETDNAGLDACRAIRSFNPFVRILLRTGQPGRSGETPERTAIDDYDIDGYLPKAELTSARLYSAVRTALRAWEQLIALERHRGALALVSDAVSSLRSFEPLEVSLERVLAAAVEICPSPLAVLRLNTFAGRGDARRVQIHLASGLDDIAASVRADSIALALGDRGHAAGAIDDGYVVPLMLHRDLGWGWLFLADASPDAIARQILPLLTTQAANALYSTVAQELLDSDAPVFEQMEI